MDKIDKDIDISFIRADLANHNFNAHFPHQLTAREEYVNQEVKAMEEQCEK